jgi:hypothetical protein
MFFCHHISIGFSAFFLNLDTIMTHCVIFRTPLAPERSEDFIKKPLKKLIVRGEKDMGTNADNKREIPKLFKQLLLPGSAAAYFEVPRGKWHAGTPLALPAQENSLNFLMNCLNLLLQIAF